MPDYSDEEIDKLSDDASESEDVLIDGKPVKMRSKQANEMDNVKYFFKLNLDKLNFFTKI